MNWIRWSNHCQLFKKLPKATAFLKVLRDIGIVPKENEVPNEESDNINEHIITSTHLQQEWGYHPSNSKFNLNDECITKLIDLYDGGQGKSNKSYIVTAERAYDILRNKIIPNKWCQKRFKPYLKSNHFSRKLQM